MKRMALGAVLALSAVPAAAGPGNGAPSGSHYNLNLIGVPKDKTADMTNTSGRTIFVNLDGTSKIWLTEGATFEVLDRNGTDSDGARFQLPPADTAVITDRPGTLDECMGIDTDGDGDFDWYLCGSGETVYSVFARALGGKGGSATLMLCGYDDGAEICSVDNALSLNSNTRPSKFQNVTANILYLYNVTFDVDNDGDLDFFKRIPLFSDALQNYFWEYTNDGLRLLQLRFYPCSTIVPADWPGPIDDNACFQ